MFVCGVRSDDSTLCLHVVYGFLREGHRVDFLKIVAPYSASSHTTGNAR